MLRRKPLPRSRTLMCVVAAATVATTAAGCSSAVGAESSAESSAQPGPGALLTHETIDTAAALPSAASTQLITYASQDAHGDPIVVSGTVSVPSSPAPDGGYPVLSWAHGTSGYADTCAPSEDTADGPDHDYFAGIDPVLDSWVQQGYAVVQTDYEGLGTPGGHPYMNGTSAANTVIDIVRAARALDDDVGSDWFVMGHSQGGQAALFTAQDADERAPGLDLQAAVAIAPGGTALGDTVQYIDAGGPGARKAEAFLPIILLGAQAADPDIDAETLLTDAARPLLTATRTGCLRQIREAPTVPPEQVFRDDADLSTLTGYLEDQQLGRVTPHVPTMIAQGTDDGVVIPERTERLAEQLCEVSPIDFREHPGEDHRGSVPAAQDDARAFVAAAMGGDRTPSTCG